MGQCLGFHGTDLTGSLHKYHRRTEIETIRNRDSGEIAMLRTALTLSSSSSLGMVQALLNRRSQILHCFSSSLAAPIGLNLMSKF